MSSERPSYEPAGLLDKAVDAVWIIDQNQIIEYVNPASEAITGYAPDELIGQSLAVILPPALKTLHQDHMDAYVKRGGASSVLGKLREFMIIAKNGAPVPIELKAFEIEPRNGVRRYGAIMRDIRERKRIEEQRDRLLHQLERLALVDQLTGLPNRRAFLDEAQRLLGRAAREGGRPCVAILDLDHFKRVNDTYGHGAGDKLLHDVAQQCRSALRSGDIVARYGGEEFSVLSWGTGLAEARQVCERVRRQIEQHVFALNSHTSLKITVSIGVAEIDPHRPFEEALIAADRALYAAKRGGRNRVMVAGPREAARAAPMDQSAAG